jgi:hypothetical protein
MNNRRLATLGAASAISITLLGMVCAYVQCVGLSAVSRCLADQMFEGLARDPMGIRSLKVAVKAISYSCC